MERGRTSAGQAAGTNGQNEVKRQDGRGFFWLLLVALIGYGAWLFLHKPTGYWNIAVFWSGQQRWQYQKRTGRCSDDMQH